MKRSPRLKIPKYLWLQLGGLKNSNLMRRQYKNGSWAYFIIDSGLEETDGDLQEKINRIKYKCSHGENSLCAKCSTIPII